MLSSQVELVLAGQVEMYGYGVVWVLLQRVDL